MAKVHVSEAVHRVVDSSVQLCGSAGILADPLGRLMNEVRPFRTHDGSNETHRRPIARRAVRARQRERGTVESRRAGERG